MLESTYKINKVGKPVGRGMTEPRNCNFKAVLKFDCVGFEHLVYSEYVAMRLAQTLHIPVADGVLTSYEDKTAYGSLWIDAAGLMPAMHHSQKAKIGERYPNEVAALTAFDILIGNWDRQEDVRASVATGSPELFRAFDHSHSLFGIEGDPGACLAELSRRELVVKAHMFYTIVRDTDLNSWAERIAAVSDHYITECCLLESVDAGVSRNLQDRLALALISRKKNLPAIIAAHKGTIRPLL
jgi:hypothetical protein